MRKRTVFITLLSVLLLGSMVTSCHKDNETPLYKELNEFIWVGLYNYYLWVDDVPELSTANYSSENALYSFWYKNTDSEAFFYSLLYQYGTVDRFSWIVDNYEELEASFQGVTKSTGAVFGRSLLRNGNIAAVVLYTVKGAPADKAGIKRGDIFYKVNDVILTTSNYSELYSATNYSLSYATVTDSVAIPTGKIANLVAEEVHENPIYLDTVYTIQNKKIGYLVYNGFMSDYDLALNNVFASFKTQKIDELILDLRYNLGGSGQTATYLASMIYATDTTAIFYKTQCNKLFGAYILETEGADALNSYFADAIVDTESSSSTPINSLNLQNLYIIATGSTASASELIINGLKPYVNVTIVGSTTVGKNVGSMTIKDYDENGVLNTRHKWAMQPIIFKVANKNGVSDYSNGIAPDIYARETRDNIKPLGDITEILLQTSLNRILGISQTSVKSIPMGRSMILSKEYAQFATELYFDSKKYGISNFKKEQELKTNLEKSKNIILSASRMTDMSAFYPEALIFEVENRLRKGLSIHTLVLWTKHPKSLFAPPLYFHLLQWQSKGIQIYVQLTITGMGGVMVGQDGDGNPIILEPGVPSMKETLDFVPRVIDLADSPDRICLRIDPLIRIMDSTGYKYSNFEMLSYLIKAGSAMGIQNFTFSFLEKGMHQKVDKIFLKKGLTISSPNSAERKIWKEELGKLEKKYKITISACCVQGFETSRCIDGYGLEKLHNLSIPVSKKEPKSRPLCGCTESIDLGGWPPKLCFSGCLYCYARPSTHRLTK